MLSYLQKSDLWIDLTEKRSFSCGGFMVISARSCKRPRKTSQQKSKVPGQQWYSSATVNSYRSGFISFLNLLAAKLKKTTNEIVASCQLAAHKSKEKFEKEIVRLAVLGVAAELDDNIYRLAGKIKKSIQMYCMD